MMKGRLKNTQKLLLLFLLLLLAAGGLFWLRPAHKTAMAVDSTYTSSREGTVGERRVCRLADSSNVVLNSASVLYIIHDFNAPLRQVQLDGDAFFEVQASAASPFVVTTNNLRATVLAPSRFRIIAPATEAGAQMEVLEGKLQVEKKYTSPNQDSEILQKGEMILFNRDIDLMEKETADTGKLQAWVDGNLQFSNTAFPAAIRQLEEWFAIKITVEGKAERAIAVNGRFHQASLTEVLRSIAAQEKCSYRLHKNQVSLSF